MGRRTFIDPGDLNWAEIQSAGLPFYGKPLCYDQGTIYDYFTLTPDPIPEKTFDRAFGKNRLRVTVYKAEDEVYNYFTIVSMLKYLSVMFMRQSKSNMEYEILGVHKFNEGFEKFKPDPNRLTKKQIKKNKKKAMKKNGYQKDIRYTIKKDK